MSSAKNCLDIDYCLVKSAANEIKFKRKDSGTVKKFKKLSKVLPLFWRGFATSFGIAVIRLHLSLQLAKKKKAYLINFLSLFNAR